LPEVCTAAHQLTALTGEADILDSLMLLSQVAVSVIPSCVAVSLTVVVDEEPFTITATSPDAAVLDAAQYLDGGPCLQAAQDQQRVDVPDVLDENRWAVYAQAATAHGVRSSLSLPIGGASSTTPWAMNLYAADPNAFTGREEAIAATFHVPTSELVRNADLSFMTRDAALELPQRLRAKATVDQAVGVLRAVRGWEADQARSRLRTAATAAGVPVEKVAEVVLALDPA
jgi:hypothetical protein